MFRIKLPYDTQLGNEVGLFYNGPEHHTGKGMFKTCMKSSIYTSTMTIMFTATGVGQQRSLND